MKLFISQSVVNSTISKRDPISTPFFFFFCVWYTILRHSLECILRRCTYPPLRHVHCYTEVKAMVTYKHHCVTRYLLDKVHIYIESQIPLFCDSEGNLIINDVESASNHRIFMKAISINLVFSYLRTLNLV